MNAKKTMVLAALLLCLAGSFAAVAAQDPAPAQPPTQAQPTAAPAQPAAQPPATVAPANPNVSVQVTRTEETSWYMNPVLIGLGVLVLIVLVVLASRGGEPNTTTIVKD